jgi:hypothetical protein
MKYFVSLQRNPHGAGGPTVHWNLLKGNVDMISADIIMKEPKASSLGMTFASL